MGCRRLLENKACLRESAVKYLRVSQGSWQQSKFRWTQTSFPPGLRAGQGARQAGPRWARSLQ